MDIIILIKEYFTNARFLVIAVVIAFTALILIINDIAGFYKDRKAESKEKEFQHMIDKKLTLIADAIGVVNEEWQALDISSAVPPIVSEAAFIIVRSKEKDVKGYIKGSGYNEQYPFNTELNDFVPIAVKIKEPKIEYCVVSPKNKKIELSIFVAGYKTNIR